MFERITLCLRLKPSGYSTALKNFTVVVPGFKYLAIVVTFLPTFLASWPPAFCAELESVKPLEEEQREVDALLDKVDSVELGKVSPRLFQLAERVLKEKGDAQARRYFEKGLEGNPWALEHQLTLGELLSRAGQLTALPEKAEMVLRIGEEEEVLQRASRLIGRALPEEPKPFSEDEGADSVLILVPVEITFESVNDNDNISDNKNPQTGQFMLGKGKRIFPDAKEPDDSEPRNRVRVKVNAGIPNIQVHLRALDIDDPSSDTEIDPNDETGLESGNDNLEFDGITHTVKPPFFVANGSETIVCTTGTDGIARINGNLPQLEVTMQPGDNFRVAVALMEDGADEVAGLQVMDKNATGYVPFGDKPPTSGFNGVVSPMLTTWRKLHIEVDTMEKWAGDKPSPDRVMATGVSWDKNNPTGHSVLTLSGVPSVPDNFYARGFIKAGGEQFNIISSTGNTVKIFHGSNNVPSDAQYDAFIGSVELHDDDDRSVGNTMLDGSNLLAFYAHGDAINDTIKKKYTPAYIEIEEVPHTEGYNIRPSIPFQLNAGQINAFTSLNDLQDMRGKDREAYWYHFVVMAYQYTEGSIPILNPGGGDNDPNGESGLEGGTTGDSVIPYISVIFLERIRDGFDNNRDDGDLLEKVNKRIDQVTAHEMGHAPGNGNNEDHAEEGLMGEGADGDEFAPKTLYRFRSTSEWQQ